jgi:hypothetical protein
MKTELIILESVGIYYNTKTGYIYPIQSNLEPNLEMGVEYKNIKDEFFNKLNDNDYQKIVNSDYYIYNS